jgi:hypothetical protein
MQTCPETSRLLWQRLRATLSNRGSFCYFLETNFCLKAKDVAAEFRIVIYNLVFTSKLARESLRLLREEG